MGTWRHMSLLWRTSIGGYRCDSNHLPHGHIQTHEFTMNNQFQRLLVCIKSLATWGYICTYWHMSSECVTSIGGCSYDSNHWPHGGTWAHKKTHEFAIDKQFQRLLVCIRSLATWGHMGIYRHMSLQWTTSLRGNSHVSNHWQYGVTWAQEDTWVHVYVCGHLPLCGQ